MSKKLESQHIKLEIRTGVLIFTATAIGIGIAVKKSREKREKKRSLTDEEFSQLSARIEQFYPIIQGYISRKLRGRPQDVEELTQDVFTGVFLNYANFKPDEKFNLPEDAFGTYCVAAAQNKLRNYFRNKRRLSRKEIEERMNDEDKPLFQKVDSELSIPHSIETKLVEPNPARDLLLEALGELNEMEKFVIYLKYFGPSKLSNEIIGFIMGRTTGAIKSLHHRAEEKIKKYMESPLSELS